VTLVLHQVDPRRQRQAVRLLQKLPPCHSTLPLSILRPPFYRGATPPTQLAGPTLKMCHWHIFLTLRHFLNAAVPAGAK
jgi:hypothetical protein